MILTDENGNEYIWKGTKFDGDTNHFGMLTRVKPKKQVIDWSRVYPDVPINFNGACFPEWHNGEPFYMTDELFDEVNRFNNGDFTLETGKWVPWFGDECPVPDGVVVIVMTRDGVTNTASDARNFQWNHFGCSKDIIAFRVVGLADGYCYFDE